MALHLGLTLVDLRSHKIDRKALALLPEAVARRNNVIPVQVNGSRLTVAMADPSNLKLVQELSSRTGANIDPVISTPDDIREHIEVAYRLTSQFVQEFQTQGQEPNQRLTASVLANVPPAQIIDLLLRQALQDRASDVHIVPTPSQLRVRFRIDGILHDTMELPLEMQATIISRLKIISGMNIAERRRAQDGQFTFDVENRTVDIRVAVSKTVHGEMTVLRLLDKKFTLMSLDQLGMGNEGLERYQRLLRLPHGMIIVSGPTGSGKSTTLYASVLQMNRTEQNVITIEDPVEYHISNTNQMQVNNEAGITFGNQLRSILRLDPDVILVGEIRDQETAIIATQAALTGHLVLTSIHANDSVSALLRLRDLGVPPYLIASSVAGIVAQRMVRVVCKGCQTVKPGSPAEREAYAAEVKEHRERFTVGSGCNMCAHTGYRGRTGVFEILSISDSLRQMFLADAPRNELWSQALKDGTAPLRQDGMLKVKEDITTPYEVMRLLSSME
jgi:general secretion pathway protein E